MFICSMDQKCLVNTDKLTEIWIHQYEDLSSASIWAKIEGTSDICLAKYENGGVAGVEFGCIMDGIREGQRFYQLG